MIKTDEILDAWLAEVEAEFGAGLCQALIDGYSREDLKRNPIACLSQTQRKAEQVERESLGNAHAMRCNSSCG